MSSAFRRTLPARPDLEQQKTLAKELLRAYRAGDRDAIARMRAELPDKAAPPSPPRNTCLRASTVSRAGAS